MGLRCSPCGITWPSEPDPRIKPPLDAGYHVCPQCQGPTDQISDDGIDADTARTLKLYLEFEHYYAANRPAGDIGCQAA